MEDYEGMAGDAPDATATATPASNENEAFHQEIEAGGDRGNGINVGSLKATSGNASKRLGTGQETQVATRASKSNATPIQQMATQEHHVNFVCKNGNKRSWLKWRSS